jgi:DNA-binding MarR family transcriptional regulator
MLDQGSHGAVLAVSFDFFNLSASMSAAPRTLPACPTAIVPPTDRPSLRAWLSVVSTYQLCGDTLTEQLKPLGIKLPQHEVLVTLLLHPQQTQQKLAQHSYVAKSHMSSLVVEMATLGWVARHDNPDDKRSKLVSLTPAGHALALQAFASQQRVMEAMFAPLTSKQIKETEAVMAQVTAALRQFKN